MRRVCPRCIGGTLQLKETTYTRVLGSHLVTVPHFPTWRCDACGYHRYDSAALARLDLIIGVETTGIRGTFTGRPRRWARSTGGPGGQDPHRWSI